MEVTDALAQASTAVGAPPEATLGTGLAASVLRYAVHSRGSVPRAALLSEVAALLAPVADGDVDLPMIVEGDLDALLAIGEVTLRQPAVGARIHVEAAPPAFVRMPKSEDSRILLLGGSLEGRPVLPDHLLGQVTAQGRARWLPAQVDGEELQDELTFCGLREVSFQAWARIPPVQAAPTLAALHLERSRPIAPDRVAALETFDPTTTNRYYTGRIRRRPAEEVTGLLGGGGCLAARDPEAIEGYLYSVLFRGECGVRGATLGFGVGARDQWLRLAAASCVARGEGHAFRWEREGALLRLFFPPPSWLERLLTLGAPAEAGGLCAYTVADPLWPAVEAALTDVAFAVRHDP